MLIKHTPSNWALSGMIIGLCFSALMAIRYFVVWPDTDKALVYIIVGVLIFCVSWLYGAFKDILFKLEAVEEFLQDKYTGKTK